MSSTAIRTIHVAGDGIVGLSAALAFSRALPGVEVTVLRLPADAAALADRFPATLPTVGRFHAAIGFDEADLVRRGIAVHHLGTRFEDGAAGRWIHSFGEVGRSAGAVPFRQLWLRARREGDALDFGAYSPASTIGAAGKFVHPSGDPRSPLASHLYGLRLNPERYRALLEEATRHLGRAVGPIAAIERRADGGNASLRLASGERREADLYVDCSGPPGALMTALNADFEDWSAWLPARHIVTAWDEPGPLEPLDLVAAIDDGFGLTASVPGATLRASATSVDLPGSTPIRPGRLRDSLVANVLAIGDAAAAFDPLHGANLSLAHSAILRAINLVPGRDCHPLELAEYNRLTALESDRVRDFHALFQAQLSGETRLPDSLARTLTQWRARGRLPFFEEETFSDSSWAQALIGLGIFPDAVAPIARAVDGPAAAAGMAVFALELGQLAERLPTYADYLAGLSRNEPR